MSAALARLAGAGAGAGAGARARARAGAGAGAGASRRVLAAPAALRAKTRRRARSVHLARVPVIFLHVLKRACARSWHDVRESALRFGRVSRHRRQGAG